jgi:hypothetical protein
MAFRRYEQNGGGGGYYVKPMAPSGYSIQRNGTIAPDISTLIDQPIVSGGWPGDFIDPVADKWVETVKKSPGLIDPSQIKATVTAIDANGDKVELALDENGEVLAAKKAPANIVPIALAAAAAWFFLM